MTWITDVRQQMLRKFNFFPIVICSTINLWKMTAGGNGWGIADQGLLVPGLRPDIWPESAYGKTHMYKDRHTHTVFTTQMAGT